MVIEIICIISGAFTIVNNWHILYIRNKIRNLENDITILQKRLILPRKPIPKK